MPGDRFGDAFAADETGADQLVGVGPVGLGAGRADRGAPSKGYTAEEIDPAPPQHVRGPS